MTTSANSIATRALLVSINISQWTARRQDKSETEQVIARTGCSKRSARVNKSLLPGCTALDKIATKAGEIRRFFNDNTLPWAGDNVRIIRAESYLDFTQRLSAHINGFKNLVRDFENNYPQYITDAYQSLGTLYKPEDYPHPHDIGDKFGVDVRFMPVPDAGDWRVEVSDEIMSDLQAKM